MEKEEDKNIRYYIDLDLKAHKIINWDYDQRDTLVVQKMKKPFYHRVFITKGQYNKLNTKQALLKKH